MHGGAAHSRWWDPIGPALAINYRVVAIDLSGHGDSGWREDYGFSHWAREAAAHAEPAGILGLPLVVGHSMGGYIAMTALSQLPECFAGGVIIDSPLPRHPLPPAVRRQVRYYATKAEILARFRLVPKDAYADPHVVRHVAGTSIVEETGGWRWKSDPNLLRDRHFATMGLLELSRPVAVFRAEHGLIPPDVARGMLAGGRFPMVTIPNAGHQILLDEPLALLAGIRTLLAAWGFGNTF